MKLLDSPGGVKGYVSWRRLTEIMADAGEIRTTELIEGFSLSEDEAGLTIHLISKT